MNIIKKHLLDISKWNYDRLYPNPLAFFVNDNHNFIFFKPGKTAGTSILGHYLMPFDRENIFFNETERFDKWIKIVNDFHIAKFFKFIVIRNPFDRMLSAAMYFKIKPSNFFEYIYKDYKKSYTSEDKEMFEGFGCPINKREKDFASLLNVEYNEEFSKYCKMRMIIIAHIVPCYNYISVNNVVFANEFLEFNYLNKSIKKLSKLFGIKIELAHVNKTEHDHYSKYYNEKTIDFINEIFIDDINFFKYKFEKT